MKRRLQLREKRGEDLEFLVYSSVPELLKENLCGKDENENYYRADCINRNCGTCGVSLLKLMEEERSDEIVDCEKFEYGEILSKANSTRKKLMFVKKQTSSDEMFAYLCKLLEPFASHQFRGNAAVTLEKNEQDDWGSVFPRTAEVITGHYYKKCGPLMFSLMKSKFAIVSVYSIVYLLETVKANVKVAIPENDLKRVLTWIEE
ncbi:hypothetical protein DPMN_188224 [Dreissena polymorpha]|uniref:Uncharacterized protein n=1 Tax=Dreissena polymorpha TaxID=45954 RepID=A0A9D4DQF1_DREPO|nr:hypothetical protein DPMN_188224 [Dreissena polymorpha]